MTYNIIGRGTLQQQAQKSATRYYQYLQATLQTNKPKVAYNNLTWQLWSLSRSVCDNGCDCRGGAFECQRKGEQKWRLPEVGRCSRNAGKKDRKQQQVRMTTHFPGPEVSIFARYSAWRLYYTKVFELVTVNVQLLALKLAQVMMLTAQLRIKEAASCFGNLISLSYPASVTAIQVNK